MCWTMGGVSDVAYGTVGDAGFRCISCWQKASLPQVPDLRIIQRMIGNLGSRQQGYARLPASS